MDLKGGHVNSKCPSCCLKCYKIIYGFSNVLRIGYDGAERREAETF